MRHLGAGVQCNLGFSGPHIRPFGCQKKCRSSWPTSLDLLLPLWQSAPPTNGVCLTGGPASPATIHSSLSMVLAGNPTYPQCPSRSWVSPGNVPIQAFGQAEGLYHLPPVVLWLNALRILSGAFCLKPYLPQAHIRSHISPVYASSET